MFVHETDANTREQFAYEHSIVTPTFNTVTNYASTISKWIKPWITCVCMCRAMFCRWKNAHYRTATTLSPSSVLWSALPGCTSDGLKFNDYRTCLLAAGPSSDSRSSSSPLWSSRHSMHSLMSIVNGSQVTAVDLELNMPIIWPHALPVTKFS